MLNRLKLHRRVQQVLPERIETVGVILDGCADLRSRALLAALPLRRRSCGTVGLWLSPRTQAAATAQGLAFLHGATRARGGLRTVGWLGDYRDWQSSPPPGGEWNSFDFTCHGTGTLRKEAQAAARQGRAGASTGQLFSACRMDGRAWLVMQPAQGVIWYCWRD